MTAVSDTARGPVPDVDASTAPTALRPRHRSGFWAAAFAFLIVMAVATLIGAGSGAVFKGTTGIVLEASPPESRVAMTSDLLIALYVGLSVPVIGAGVALELGASAPDTVLGFAILVGLGVAVSGWALLGRRGSQVRT